MEFFKSEDGKEMVDIKISRQFLTVMLIVVFAVLFLTAGTGIYVLRGYKDISRSYHIQQENALLRDRIYVLNSEIDSILIKLELMEHWEDEIRSRENFEEINKEVREMGVGGLPIIDRELSITDSLFQMEYSLLISRLTQTRSKAYFDFDTHKELRENYHLRDNLYNSTPSIYPTFGRLSSGYGYRTHPITGKRDFHSGLDLSNVKGTPIYATADGEVYSVGYKRKLGRYIKIRHNFGFVTVYGHLNEQLVKKGDKVHKGEMIAKMGKTGEATGSHLHYEVIRYKRHRNPINYLTQERSNIALK